MSKKEVAAYTADTVQSLTPIEAMRKRPTVFIGETGKHGVMHLLKEVVANSVDEFLQGFGKTIVVSIDAIDPNAPKFKVRDFARGIPHEKLWDSVATMNTSGKYGDIEGKGGDAYGVSAGLKFGPSYSNI